MTNDSLQRIWPTADTELVVNQTIVLKAKDKKKGEESVLQNLVDEEGRAKKRDLGKVVSVTFRGWGKDGK